MTIGFNRREIALGLVASFGLAASPGQSRSLASPGLSDAQGVLERLLGRRALDIDLRLGAPTHKAWFRTTVRHGRLTVSGSDPVALVRGAYSFLKSSGYASVSWEGSRTQMPDRFVAAKSKMVESAFHHRAYLNPCTFGYTTPWWDWTRWQHEIDWMALHGVDMPLALEGQEYVWQALWREQGLSGDELSAYFSGPAFTPWQRMGNIEGYDTPLPQAWIDKKRDLQIRILQRMRALGMSPVLPAFGGYVPKAFAEKHPQARIYRMRAWEGFHETYWLDPADPLFAILAGRFLELYAATYGAGSHYLADSFNEMLPPVSGADAGAGYGDATANKAAIANVDPGVKAQRLADYGAAIYNSITHVQPKATWVMQGWLFGADRDFWDDKAISAFLSRVPNDGLMILDIGNDRYPDVWRRAGAFHGKSWIYGYVHNYGASNPLYGDLDFYKSDVAAIVANPGKENLQGFGTFPEGLENNSVVYEFLYDLAWSDAPTSVNDWLVTYIRARYGHLTPRLLDAWKDFQAAVYRTRYWTPRWWNSRAGAYLFFKRPTLDASEFPEMPGDHKLLKQAVTKLLAAAPDAKGSPLFVQDVVDAIRHFVSGEIDRHIKAALVAYAAGHVDEGGTHASAVSQLALGVDALLGNQAEGLASWIDAARQYGDTPAEKAYYAQNAKAQVTIWGGKGNLNDYASKAWQGMYAQFYLPRWSQMFSALRSAAVNAAAFDQVPFTQAMINWETDWVGADTPYRRHRPENPLKDARALLALTVHLAEITP